MKFITQHLIVFLFVVLALPISGSAQDNLPFELKCEVNRVYPFISITKAQLTSAKTLIDLDEKYESSWVKEYVSVEISASHDGKLKTVKGENNILNAAQKKLINTADAGTDISVKVLYIPDNTLSKNDIKDIQFIVAVDPDNKATYPGGQEKLTQYLKKNVVDKIPSSTFKQYNLTAVKFTVDESGKITNADVFESSRDEKVDELLLEMVQNMPSWKPAEYANGLKVEQEFVLTIGDMQSCVINLLNIRKNLE